MIIMIYDALGRCTVYTNAHPLTLIFTHIAHVINEPKTKNQWMATTTAASTARKSARSKLAKQWRKYKPEKISNRKKKAAEIGYMFVTANSMSIDVHNCFFLFMHLPTLLSFDLSFHSNLLLLLPFCIQNSWCELVISFGQLPEKWNGQKLANFMMLSPTFHCHIKFCYQNEKQLLRDAKKKTTLLLRCALFHVSHCAFWRACEMWQCKHSK